MRRRIAVVVAGTVLALGAATVWVPTSFSPAFHAVSGWPNWPDVVAYQPIWRLADRAAARANQSYFLETDGDVSVGSATSGSGVRVAAAGYLELRKPDGVAWRYASPNAASLTVCLDEDAYAFAVSGPRLLGIEWSPMMRGGFIAWPLLALEHAAILLLAGLAITGLVRRERRRRRVEVTA